MHQHQRMQPSTYLELQRHSPNCVVVYYKCNRAQMGVLINDFLSVFHHHEISPWNGDLGGNSRTFTGFTEDGQAIAWMLVDASDDGGMVKFQYKADYPPPPMVCAKWEIYAAHNLGKMGNRTPEPLKRNPWGYRFSALQPIPQYFPKRQHAVVTPQRRTPWGLAVVVVLIVIGLTAAYLSN